MTEIDVLLESAVDKNFQVFESIVLEQILHFTKDEPVVPFHFEVGQPSFGLNIQRAFSRKIKSKRLRVCSKS